MGEAVFDRVARFYDCEQKEFTKDIPFYMEYAKQCGGEVLELACGTGRVLIPLAKQGIIVTGLDASGEMLNIARKKIAVDQEIETNIALINADMRTFNIKKEFSMIFIAFRSFQCLLTKEDQVACLRAVCKHLAVSGLFILDLFAPRHDLLAQVRRTFELDKFHDEENDVYVTRRAEDKYDLARQTLHEDRFYEWIDKSGESHVQRWSFELSYLFKYEAELLLEKCGFRVEDVYGDFSKVPYDYYSGEQIFVTRKA
jgi:ubiquinone/menaquinone biosynthesis C-methylase UbiE